MSDLCIDWGSLSRNHVGELLCGDNVTMTEMADGSHILVLADGMGSGIKANILSTLTSTMMAKMVGENLDIDQCVQTVIATLPICKVRQIAYATFTVIYAKDTSRFRVYNYDNPRPFLIRHGKAVLPDYEKRDICGKRVEVCEMEVQSGDCLFAMSDGVLNAGVGETLNYGWELPQIMHYMENVFTDRLSAKALATTLVDRCNNLYNGKPGDDVTCAVMRVREREVVNVMIGPSSNIEDDEMMVAAFVGNKGKHVVCGGTTASVVARCLKKEVKSVYEDNKGSDIPPISKIDGIDLVTEGMITWNRVLQYAEDFAGDNETYFDWNYKTDGASLLASLLFEEATDIDIFFGCAVNKAHQANTALSISLKMELVDKLADELRRMRKVVSIHYY